jgi:nucleoside-diphosphate-sugar epimerase
MTLFVTGGESFIGRALVARCKKHGIDVAGIDLKAPRGSLMKQADIRDSAVGDLIPEGATIVHLAAISRDADCRADPRAAFDVNVNGTINILAAAQQRKALQFIFASSEWVYGDVKDNSAQVEDQAIDVTTTKSEYALTKIVGEQYLRLVSKLPATTILRFGIVYGPRADNWSAAEALLNTVRTQPEVKVGSLATARRFIHVSDIVDGILATRGFIGFQIFNLSGDRPVSLGEVVKTSMEITGRQPSVVETNAAYPSIRNPDNAKMRKNSGWRPSIDLKAGLLSVADFLASNA